MSKRVVDSLQPGQRLQDFPPDTRFSLRLLRRLGRNMEKRVKSGTAPEVDPELAVQLVEIDQHKTRDTLFPPDYI